MDKGISGGESEREERIMSKAWKYHGRLDNGEAVFVGEGGEIAIEKDHRTLVEPKPLELYNIYQKWPAVAFLPVRPKGRYPRGSTDVIEELRGVVVALETEADKHINTIDALKYSNDERDKMIASLMEDIAAGKETVKEKQTRIDWLIAKRN